MSTKHLENFQAKQCVYYDIKKYLPFPVFCHNFVHPGELILKNKCQTTKQKYKNCFD